MALEVLAIVAFKQPITRAEIEKLRGVSSERVLTSLVEKKRSSRASSSNWGARTAQGGRFYTARLLIF